MKASKLFAALPLIACLQWCDGYSQPPDSLASSEPIHGEPREILANDSASFSGEEVRQIALLLDQRITSDTEITVNRGQIAALVRANSEQTKGRTAADAENVRLRMSLNSCQDETKAVHDQYAGQVAPGWRIGCLVTVGVVVVATTVAILVN